MKGLRWAALGAACAAVIVILALIAGSIGSRLKWSADPGDSDFNLLVRGFQAGQLNLKKDVPAGFRKLPDPYDPRANEDYRLYPYGLHDLSYYGGKLYLYFGVVPALVLYWPWFALTGRYLQDHQAAVICCSLGFLACGAVFAAVWRRFFPKAGLGVAASCVLALGLAGGLPVLLEWSNVYEVTIGCGYAMLMLAFGSICGALLQPARRGWWLAAASLCYGLALGSRPSLLFGAIILAIPIVVGRRVPPAPDGSAQSTLPILLLAAAGPLLLIGIGLMIYNLRRFGNPLEFGQHYQLLVGSYRGTQPTFSPRYLSYNLRLYLLEPVRLVGRFPFVRDAAPVPLPLGHGVGESTFGILTDVPFTWLALAAPLACRNQNPADRAALGWLLASIAILFCFCALTLGCFWWSSARYELEFLPALMLLAVFGVLGLERALEHSHSWRLASRFGWGSLLLLSIAFNLLASFQHRAEQYFQHGKMMLTLGRPPEAIADFKESLRLDPENGDVRKNLGTAVFDDAEMLLALGQIPEAIAEFQDYLARNPDSADAENRLGFALVESGSSAEAVVHFERALRLKPDLWAAHNNLALVLARMGRRSEAIAQFKEALQINPANAEDQYLLGVLLGLEGERDEAIAHLNRALELQPDFPRAKAALKKLRPGAR